MAIDRAQMKECIAKILEGFEYYGELTNRKVREKLEQKMGLEQQHSDGFWLLFGQL